MPVKLTRNLSFKELSGNLLSRCQRELSMGSISVAALCYGSIWRECWGICWLLRAAGHQAQRKLSTGKPGVLQNPEQEPDYATACQTHWEANLFFLSSCQRLLLTKLNTRLQAKEKYLNSPLYFHRTNKKGAFGSCRRFVDNDCNMNFSIQGRKGFCMDPELFILSAWRSPLLPRSRFGFGPMGVKSDISFNFGISSHGVLYIRGP